MSEPKAVAESLEEVAPGVWRWYVWDDRIAAESDAHAVSDPTGAVLIDPLPLREEALKRLEPIIAICLTAACHQRSAWRYRRTFGVKVYAPEGCRAMDEEPDVHYFSYGCVGQADLCRAMDEEPDVHYRAGDVLAGELKVVHTPGPEQAHYAFWREPSPSVLFCPDLIMREGNGDLAFIPAEYHDDPEATRESVRRLLALPFEVLCMDHAWCANQREPAHCAAEIARRRYRPSAIGKQRSRERSCHVCSAHHAGPGLCGSPCGGYINRAKKQKATVFSQELGFSCSQPHLRFKRDTVIEISIIRRIPR